MIRWQNYIRRKEIIYSLCRKIVTPKQKLDLRLQERYCTLVVVQGSNVKSSSGLSELEIGHLIAALKTRS